MSACFQASLGIYAEISAIEPVFQEDLRGLRRRSSGDAYLWMQLSEYNFDTFMMIQQRGGKLGYRYGNEKPRS
jgi:TRAP-type mannitol/chloroaromatic compound transport system substrate-binding protein